MFLVSRTGLHRRHLGDNFDERIQQHHQSFVVTVDNRFIISTGYRDKSFRIQNTDTTKTTQVLYGHFDIVTCICRSEVTTTGTCFIATGSRDFTICIWIWNGAKGAIVDKHNLDQGKINFNENRNFFNEEKCILDINPSPASILTGHDSEIVCLWLSTELGIVLSGSEHGLVFQHTVHGDVLRTFEKSSDMSTPRLLLSSSDGDVVVCYDQSTLCLYTLNGKLMREATFEQENIRVKIFFSNNRKQKRKMRIIEIILEFGIECRRSIYSHWK